MADPKKSNKMSISGNSESTSAAKKKGINSVKSKATSTDIVDVDENVAEVIGIQDNFDLSYGEYRTLLKEAAIRGRDDNSPIDGETTEKITQEYRRIKGKEGQIRPKVKKVSFQKVFNTKPPKVAGLIGGSSSLALRSPDALKEKEEKEEDKKEMMMDKYVSSSLTKITKNIFDIEKVVVTILGDEKTKAKRDNQAIRDAKRKEKEEAGEKAVAKKSKSFLQGFKPKIPFMDQIKTYFGNILAGGAVLGLLNWVNDPENQKKIDSFTTFLQDSVPVILAGFAALIAFDLGMKLLGFVKLFVPVLTTLIGFMMNPAVLLALAGIGAAILIDKGVDMARDAREGAEAQKDHDALNQQLRDAGMTPRGMNISSDIGEGEDGRTPAQEAIYQEVQKRRKILHKYSEGMRSEFDAVDRLRREQIEAIQEKDSKYTIKNVYGNRVLTEEGEAEVERIKQEAEERKKKIREEFDKEVATPGSVMRGGISLTDQVMGTGEVTTERIDERLSAAEKAKKGSNTRTRVPGVGSIVAGRNFFGIAETKYYNVNGEQIKKEEFDKLVKGVKSRIEGGEKITIPSVTPQPGVGPGSEKETAEKVKPRTLTEAEFTEARNNADILDEYNDEIGNSRNYEEYLKSKGLIVPRDDKKMGVDAEELPIAPVQKTQPAPDPPGATDKDDVTVMPGPEAGPNASTASSQPAADVAFFSSEDTGNDSILGVKGLYNVTAVAA